jgi:hypothetical protein
MQSPKLSRTLVFLTAVALCLSPMLGCATKSREDPQDLHVITMTPANGQSNVSPTAQIILRFSEPIDHRTVLGTQQIILADQSNSVVPVSYQFQGELVIITPGSPLASSATYGVAVRPGVRDVYGNNMEQPWAGLFATGPVVGSIPNWPPFTYNTPAPIPSFPPGEFTMVGQLWVPRWRHEAVLLDSGKVLVCGGCSQPNTTSVIRSAEIYDPATRTWSLSQSNNSLGMHFVRYDHRLVKLNNGHVLITGGGDNLSIWDTCEEYNPLTDNFSLWPARLQTARAAHTAELLANGNPIVIGGISSTGALLNTLEVFDWAAGAWVYTNTPMFGGAVSVPAGPGFFANITSGRANHLSITMYDGAILNVGGGTVIGVLNLPDLFYPGGGSGVNAQGRSTATFMSAGRSQHSATLFTSGYQAGLVCVVGGNRTDMILGHNCNTAELYDHSVTPTNPVGNGLNGVWTPVGQTTILYRLGHTGNVLPNGKILVAGGATAYAGATPTSWSDTAELFDPFGLGYNVNAPFSGIDLTGQFDWTRDAQGNQAVMPNLWTGLYLHTGTGLLTGNVLITGGLDFIPPPFNIVITSGMSFVYAP